jgi:L-phenylalanine/L-methionine N-acetyltransferase
MSGYTIRRVEESDAQPFIDFLKVLADEPDNHISFESSADVTRTVEEEAELIRKYNDDNAALWLVACDDEGRMIGNVNLAPGRRGFRHTVTLGISVAKEWRNRGLGTTLMKQALDWCEKNPLIKRVELEVFGDNDRAQHVYEKLGFEREGVRREAFLKGGRFRDSIMMAIRFDRPELGS